MPSENIKSEQQLQQINPRTYALSGNRQAVSGSGAFAQAFDSLTQVAGATVPRFTGSNVINAAVSAAGQSSRMAVSGPPTPPPGGGDTGLNPLAPPGMGGGGDAMSQMNYQIDRMAASNAVLMSAQVRVGELTTQTTGVSSVIKQKYENENNLARNAKVS